MMFWMVIIFVYTGEYFFVMENHYYNSSINHSPTSYKAVFPQHNIVKEFHRNGQKIILFIIHL